MNDKKTGSHQRHQLPTFFRDTRGSEVVQCILLIAIAALLLLGVKTLGGFMTAGASQSVARLVRGRDNPPSDSHPGDDLPEWTDPADEPPSPTPPGDGTSRDDSSPGGSGGGTDADSPSRDRDDRDDPAEDTERDTLEEQLDDIERRYRRMIARARSIGWNVAADNLQRFLDGTGEGEDNKGKWIDPKWLQGFAAVAEGEDRNRAYFESEINSQGDSLDSIAQGLNDGRSAHHADYWETLVESYSPTKELSFASGTSTLKTSGQFTLTRRGDEVAIEGTITNDWLDPYDWHENLGFFVPGFGDVSDTDALLLQVHRGARPFTMRSRWRQVWRGTYSLSTGKFTWSQ